jgi:hypothetical protein
LVLGVCAFSALGAKQPPTKQNALCSGNMTCSPLINTPRC